MLLCDRKRTSGHDSHEKGEDMPCLEKLLLREESEALIFPSPSFFLRSHDSMDV
jgi:hypothetical protein